MWKTRSSWAVPVCGLLIGSCAVEAPYSDGEAEEVASAEQEWGSDACQKVPADYLAQGTFDPDHLSPDDYGRCYKTYIAELDSPTPGSRVRIESQFPTLATNQTDCEKRFLGVITYHDEPTGAGGAPYVWVYKETAKRFGAWIPQMHYCADPQYVEEFAANAESPSHRFAVTARPRDSSKAPVVPVNFSD